MYLTFLVNVRLLGLWAIIGRQRFGLPRRARILHSLRLLFDIPVVL